MSQSAQTVLALAAATSFALASIGCAGRFSRLATAVVVSIASEGSTNIQAQAVIPRSVHEPPQQGPAAVGQFPPPFPYRQFDPDSAVRLDVTPREAEVYVDGYYAGIVDEFDGFFQRLRLMSGPHEITVYRDGYRSFTQKVYLTPDHTLRLRLRMEPLGAGETAEARPVPAELPDAPPFPQRPDRRIPSRPPAGPPEAPPASQGSGTLALRVDPPDATLLIDGEPWQGPATMDRLVELSDGQHTVQVNKRGYVSFLTDVRIRRGETTTLDVTLRANPS
jgi:hypothetical protein